MKREKYIWEFCLYLSMIFQTRIAVADLIMPPMPYEAIQEQQNVKVTVRQKADWIDAYPDMAMVRIQGDEETIVVSDINLTGKEPTEEVHTCGYSFYVPIDVNEFCGQHPDACVSCPGYDPTTCAGTSCDDCYWSYGGIFSPRLFYEGNEFCELYPEYEVDCDMDGSSECCLDCTTYLDFDFVDYCVPPDSTEYRLTPYGMGIISIDVVDSGYICEAPSTDEPATTDDSEYPDGSVTSDESESSDELDATDEVESSDEINSSDEPEDSDEPTASDESESSDEPETTDDVESSDEPVTTDEEETSDEPVTSDEYESSDQPWTTDEVESSDEPEATDKVESSDEPEATDDMESSDELEATDEVESSDEPEATDDMESSDEPAATDEVESSDEDSEPTTPTAYSKSDGGCGCVHLSHSEAAAPVRLVELLILSGF